MKIVSFHINNVNNVEVRYEYIENADMNDIVEYKGSKGTIRDILLDVKINEMPFFTGVEQGSGWKRNCIFLLMTPRLRSEAKLWLK